MERRTFGVSALGMMSLLNNFMLFICVNYTSSTYIPYINTPYDKKIKSIEEVDSFRVSNRTGKIKLIEDNALKYPSINMASKDFVGANSHNCDENSTVIKCKNTTCYNVKVTRKCLHAYRHSLDPSTKDTNSNRLAYEVQQNPLRTRIFAYPSFISCKASSCMFKRTRNSKSMYFEKPSPINPKLEEATFDAEKNNIKALRWTGRVAPPQNKYGDNTTHGTNIEPAISVTEFASGKRRTRSAPRNGPISKNRPVTHPVVHPK